MLLLATLARADDVQLNLALDQQTWSITFADLHPGPLPGLVFDPGGHETRVDLNVTSALPEHLTVTYRFAQLATKTTPEEVLWEGTMEGGGTAMPTFMAMEKEHSVQLVVVTAHAAADITTGPLSGCQFVRYAGMTDVACPSASLRHHRIEAVALDEIEAGVARAKANPALTVEAGAVPLKIGGHDVKGFRVIVKSAGTAPSVNLMAWLGADGKDEVRCAGPTEAMCMTYLEAFAAGLPSELR